MKIKKVLELIEELREEVKQINPHALTIPERNMAVDREFDIIENIVEAKRNFPKDYELKEKKGCDKCKTCGHKEADHYNPFLKIFPNLCKKFISEDVPDHEKYDKDIWGKHTLTKKKKGCGNAVGQWDCGEFNLKGDIVLCPSCTSNQSPVLVGQSVKSSSKDKPEEKCSSKVVSPPSGDNSPRVSLSSSPGDTKTLSDYIVLDDYGNPLIELNKVKYFIAKLKEELKSINHHALTYAERNSATNREIDKIFGERLT